MNEEAVVMGQRQHRAWVGPPDYFDRLGAVQFTMLLSLGMRETDTLLDIGCGSLRGGRFSLLYLNPERYFGIEPEDWCLRDGIDAELGRELIALKQPAFSHNHDFDARHFGRSFDYVMAAGIFMHASRAQIDQCLRSVAHVLARDGVFVGAYLPGSVDSTEPAWTYPDIQFYRPDTLVLAAAQHDLTLAFLDAPHPLDHQWFVVTRAASARRIERSFSMETLSWKEYLSDQLRKRGGASHSHEHYLKRDLIARLPADDASIVPQARR
jgi:hypothetical protein